MFRRYIALACVVSVAYWLYLPLPEGGEEPVKTRLILSVFRALTSMVSALNYIGNYDHPLSLLQTLLDSENSRKFLRCEPHPGLKVSNQAFDGIPVRVYDPKGRSRNSAAVVYFHGGGWVIGNIDQYDCLVQQLALRTGVMFVSVEYRLAPDHRHPGGVDDCVTATKFLMNNAASFDVNSNRIAVAGDSAGGHLSAVTAMKLRDEDYPIRPAAQVLIYPGTQAFDFNTPSYQMYGHRGGLLTKKLVLQFWSLTHVGTATPDDMEALATNAHVTEGLYSKLSKDCNKKLIPIQFLEGFNETDKLANEKRIHATYEHLQVLYTDPYRSPLLAEDLSGLPNAYVLTFEFDPIRDDGIMFASRLQASGNVVQHKHYNSGFHGVMNFCLQTPLLKIVDSAIDDIADYIKQNV